MLVKLLAGIVLLATLWWLFRLAMGLRFAKLSRDEARRAEESRGRRVVAELPGESGRLGFFLEDEERFYWPAFDVRKSAVLGARLVLNGAVMAAFSRNRTPLPEPAAPEAGEDGRERWDVLLHLDDGRVLRVPCGTLREGVSREIAARVFGAVRESIHVPPASS